MLASPLLPEFCLHATCLPTSAARPVVAAGSVVHRPAHTALIRSGYPSSCGPCQPIADAGLRGILPSSTGAGTLERDELAFKASMSNRSLP